MIRRPPRSTLSSSSAASDVYKRQERDRTSGGGDRASDGELYEGVVAAWPTGEAGAGRRELLPEARHHEEPVVDGQAQPDDSDDVDGDRVERHHVRESEHC